MLVLPTIEPNHTREKGLHVLNSTEKTEHNNITYCLLVNDWSADQIHL